MGGFFRGSNRRGGGSQAQALEPAHEQRPGPWHYPLRAVRVVSSFTISWRVTVVVSYTYKAGYGLGLQSGCVVDH
eukprot:388908-Amphidinium_carterae.1